MNSYKEIEIDVTANVTANPGNCVKMEQNQGKEVNFAACLILINRTSEY